MTTHPSLLPASGNPPPRPALWIALGLFAGQAWAAAAGGWLPLGAIALFAAPCLLWWRVRGAALGLALLAAAMGHQQTDRLLRPHLSSDHVALLAGQTVHARGRIVDRPSRSPQRTRFTLAVESIRRGSMWQPARGRVQVTVREATQPWKQEEAIEAAFRLRRPRNFGNPGEFDYESFLARRRTYVLGYANTDLAWASRSAPPAGLVSAVATWREAVRQSIEARLTGSARQIVSALLIGDASSLAPEVRERYSRTGLSHVLAISGLHVGLVAAAGYGAFRWLLARSEWLLLRANVPKLSMGLSVLPILLYGGIAGGNVPTLRAVVMIVLVLMGTTLDRPRDWLVTLAVAALIVGLLWPGALFEISFQLSFAAVAAIVVGMKRVVERWRSWEEERLIRLRRGRWGLLRWVVLYQAVTLCAMLGTAPLGAWHFNRVSLIGVIANPLIVPLIGLIPVAAGLVAVLLQPFAPRLAGDLLGWIGIVVAFADGIVGYFASLPGAAVYVVTPSPYEVALIYATLAALLIRPPLQRRLALSVLGVLLIVDVGSWVKERYHRRDLRLTFLSVGQGDSTLIEFPGSAVMVVDGGGLSFTFDVGERIVAPQLWRRKIRRINHFVLSHPDFDHYGGLRFLAPAFAASDLWWNGSLGRGRSFDEFWRTLDREGVELVDARPPFRRTIGGVEVESLSPDRRHPPSKANDHSLTIRLRYGPTTILLPGDLEQMGERRLLARHPDGVRSDILKVPHHGSRTSSTAAFLAAVSPKIAVASMGHQNRFGMPHPEVIQAYRRIGAGLWRTDVDGAIVVTVSGDGRIDVSATRSGRSERVGGHGSPSTPTASCRQLGNRAVARRGRHPFCS